MPTKFCESCSAEREENHKCYTEVDRKYFDDVVLHEFFVKCGLCGVSVGLGALLEGGWKRINNVRKKEFNRGFVCPACSKSLQL